MDIWDELDKAAGLHIKPTQQENVVLTPSTFSLGFSQEWGAHVQRVAAENKIAEVVVGQKSNFVDLCVIDLGDVDLQSPQKYSDTEDLNKAAEGLVQLVEANIQADVQVPEQIKDTGIVQVPISEVAEVLPEVLEPNKPIELVVEDIEQGVVIKTGEVSPDNFER